MTIKELKEKLADLPDTMDVFIAPRVTDFAYGLVNSAYVEEINFSEEPGGKSLGSDKVFILDEE
jgi:hypothetical protein